MYICNMETIKIDRTKVRTITNYAKMVGQTRQAIHAQIKRGEIITVTIDGVLFVKIK